MGSSELKKKTTVSLFWSFLDKFGQQILNFMSMFILMNIVSTKDYGLIASLGIFVAVSGLLIDSGFGRALLNRKEVSAKEYSSVFYFNIGFAVFIYLLLFFAAPFIAKVFDAPLLTAVSRVLFLAFLFNALGLAHQTMLMKRADFKGISKINILALFIADVVAVVMAVLELGVWALVAQVIVYALLRTVFLWMHLRWRPSLHFDTEALKSFFVFSHKLVMASSINATVNNFYPSLIAMFHPMNQVAFYNQGKKYQDIPFLTINNTFRSVAMVVLSEINDDTARLRRVISKLIKSIAFLSFPIGFYLMLVAEPVFHLFFKEKWLEAVPYFQILCLAGMVTPFIHILSELLIAREKSSLFIGIEVIKAVVIALLVILLFPKGITALAISWVIYTYITLIISSLFTQKAICYTFFDLLKDVVPYAFIALICGFVAYFISKTVVDDIFFIVINALIVSGLYLLLCYFMKLEMTKEIGQWFASKRKTPID